MILYLHKKYLKTFFLFFHDKYKNLLFFPISVHFGYMPFLPFWGPQRNPVAPFSLYKALSFHAYLDLESHNLTAHKRNFFLLSVFHDKIKNLLFLPISAHFLIISPCFSAL